jgi:hypothetical protein
MRVILLFLAALMPILGCRSEVSDTTPTSALSPFAADRLMWIRYVDALYVALLNRHVTKEEIAAFSEDVPLATVRQQRLASPEYKRLHPD